MLGKTKNGSLTHAQSRQKWYKNIPGNMSDDRKTAICRFTGITHISGKISRFAVSRESLIFQKRFPDGVSRLHRPYIASKSSTRSHIATTKQKLIILNYEQIDH